MANTYLLGKGTKLEVITGSAFQAVTQVVSMTLPSITREELDITSLESVGTEFGYGLAEASEMSFTAIFDPKNPLHAWLVNNANSSSAALNAYKVTLGNSTTAFQFSGSLKEFSTDSFENKKDLRATWKVKPSNGVTFTA